MSRSFFSSLAECRDRVSERTLCLGLRGASHNAAWQPLGISRKPEPLSYQESNADEALTDIKAWKHLMRTLFQGPDGGLVS
jgi:hypothetical protein